MTITTELDSLRNAVAGCQIAAYADLSTGLVLSVSSVRRPPQEELDALSERASSLLDGPAAATIGDPSAEAALDMSLDRTAAFFRSPVEPGEVLCCVGSAAMDVAKLLDEARAALRRMDTRE